MGSSSIWASNPAMMRGSTRCSTSSGCATPPRRRSASATPSCRPSALTNHARSSLLGSRRALVRLAPVRLTSCMLSTSPKSEATADARVKSAPSKRAAGNLDPKRLAWASSAPAKLASSSWSRRTTLASTRIASSKLVRSPRMPPRMALDSTACLKEVRLTSAPVSLARGISARQKVASARLQPEKSVAVSSAPAKLAKRRSRPERSRCERLRVRKGLLSRRALNRVTSPLLSSVMA